MLLIHSVKVSQCKALSKAMNKENIILCKKLEPPALLYPATGACQTYNDWCGEKQTINSK